MTDHAFSAMPLDSLMKTASMREVQHNLATVIEAVGRGQEIAITKRGKIVARIVPARATAPQVAWPDSAGRMKRLGRLARRHAAVLGTRSLDILHVAAAQMLAVRDFVTGDRRQAALAQAVGLTVRMLRPRR